MSASWNPVCQLHNTLMPCEVCQDETDREFGDNQEAVDRKSEWMAHECTNRLLKELYERRASLLVRLLSDARNSSDPVINGHGNRLHEIDHLIFEMGLKKLGEKK